MRISTVILVGKDNEKSIEKTIYSVALFSDEVIVINDGSAMFISSRKYEEYIRPLDNFKNQRNFGIEKSTGDYIFMIDSDEEATDMLMLEISRLKKDNLLTAEGYKIKFRGKYGKKFIDEKSHVRLFKRNYRYTSDVHEVLKIKGSKTLKWYMIHDNWRGFDYWFKKLDNYAKMKAKKEKFVITKMFLLPVIHFFESYLVQRKYKLGKLGFIMSMTGAFNCHRRFAYELSRM